MNDSVATIGITDTSVLAMPEAKPKPTSTTGQFESVLEVWASADGAIETGYWECDPGTFTASRDGYDEVAQIICGTATVTGDDGAVVELGPGSTIVTPAGWTGTWRVHETMRKLYVIRNL
jgi:uncharacterized cupin superfamily protein